MSRRLADHLGVDLLADGIGDVGGVEVGQSAADAGFGLRGIGRRDVAGIETPLGRGLDFTQDLNIGALRLEQRVVGHHVHVGGDRVEEDALLDVAQRLAPRLHLEFRDPNVVGGPVAVEQNLRHRQADGPWPQGRALHGVVGQDVAHSLQAGRQARHQLRTIAGHRLRHVLVRATLPGAFGIELGIGLIGLDQCVLKRGGGS